MSTNAGGAAKCAELAHSIEALPVYASPAYARRAGAPRFDKGHGPHQARGI